MKKIAFLILAGALLLAACAPASAPVPTFTPPPTDTPVPIVVTSEINFLPPTSTSEPYEITVDLDLNNIASPEVSLLMVTADGTIFGMEVQKSEDGYLIPVDTQIIFWFDTCDGDIQHTEIPPDAVGIKFDGCGLSILGNYLPGNPTEVVNLAEVVTLWNEGKLCLPPASDFGELKKCRE